MYRILILLFLSAWSIACSNNRQIPQEEVLEDKSLKELRIIRNEVFARHGYIFKSQDLREHFSSFDWYAPLHEDVNHLLTKKDKLRIRLIVEREKELKLIQKKNCDEDSVPVALVPDKFQKGLITSTQKNLINRYLEQNREKLIDDFKNFWGFDIKAKTFHFNILENTIWLNGKNRYALVKLEVIGRSERSSGTAFNWFVFKLADESIDRIHETKFYQPECGTADYNLTSIFNLNIAQYSLPTILQSSMKQACCGQAKEMKEEWLLLSSSLHQHIASLEIFFNNDNQMDCGPINPPPPETRKTTYKIEGEEILANIQFF